MVSHKWISLIIPVRLALITKVFHYRFTCARCRKKQFEVQMR